MPTTWFDADFFSVPVIAVLRGLDVERTLEYSERAWAAGVQHVEVPIQTPEAVPSLRAAAKRAAELGKRVGAGTVTTREQLEVSRDCDVSFSVSPGLDPAIVRASIELGLPHLPGVATASEILAARNLGLEWLKVFPASELGPGWIKAQRGPFPQVRFICTGGMTPENAPAMLTAGADAVGLSGAFASDSGAAAAAALIAAHARG
ncbi:bifunctional 4-hydroxy-2-oxoglutarate aldolase/2-dehydro-3-deoxy-phosphogluconate aldolase [Micrococcales bacterium 31B]|nr:bifunctional 4-hydroxy-2-oxoglutarate aldolase/2-dehydro-3-deoxy-phosphogluconate aldolase [Micrococcales bacterium 31B]